MRNPDRRFSPGPPAALNRRSRCKIHRGNDGNGLARKHKLPSAPSIDRYISTEQSDLSTLTARSLKFISVNIVIKHLA